MRYLIIALFAIQAGPTPTAADKFEGVLKKVGERSYRIAESGTDAGTVTLKSTVRKEGDRKVAVLEAAFTVKMRDEESTLAFSETADLNGLKFISARRSGTTPEGKVETTVEIKEGKAVITGDGEESSHAIGKESVGDLALLWLVCAAEQKKDATLKLDVLNLLMPGHEPGHVFTCLGPETLEVGGRKIDTFKWVEKGEWKHPMNIRGRDLEMTSKVENHYWVGAEGHLVRFTSGRVDMTLIAK